MKIRFVTPHSSKQVGGIAHAVEGLRESLQGQGVEVLPGGDPVDKNALHHFHGLWEPSHSGLAGQLRKFGLPYVVSPHGMLEPWAFHYRRWKKLPYFWLIERRFLAGARSVFVTSSMEAEHLAKVITLPSVEVVPLGCRDHHGPDYVSARKMLSWPADERIILYLSRIDIKKGLDMLIHSITNGGLKGKWRLVIVGDGTHAYVDSLKTMAASLGNKIPIEWVGAVWGEGRWAYLQGSDVFCLPTHSENFGIAVLEALHVGTPVLTTDQTPWVKYHELDGLFITKPEIPSIREALSEASSRLQLGWSLVDRDNLANWANKNFSWSSIIDSYIKVYKKCMVK